MAGVQPLAKSYWGGDGFGEVGNFFGVGWEQWFCSQ